jgi:hypothetical protein
MFDPRWKALQAAVEERTEQLLEHELYRSLDTVVDLRTFMEHHVFAVWDFMSLLSRLQRDLTCTTVPWVPLGWPAEVQRFVNEIKLGEESDDVPGIGPMSHFELYLGAMRQVGADPNPVLASVHALQWQRTADVPGLIRACGAPEGAVRFVTNTMRTAQRGSLVQVAAAFAFGREQIIPDMFRAFLGSTEGLLERYLLRHIEVDGDDHGPASHRLLAALCESDEDWEEAEGAVMAAIEARYRLWSDTLAAIRSAPR